MKVQQILQGRRKSPSKIIAKEFIFKGLIRCSNPECQCVYGGERKKEKFVYYSCTNAKKVCKRVYMTEKKLLEPIYKVLDSIQLSENQAAELVNELRKSLDTKSYYQKNEIKRLRKEYDKIQWTIDGLAKKYALDKIDDELYERVIADNKNR